MLCEIGWKFAIHIKIELCQNDHFKLIVFTGGEGVWYWGKRHKRWCCLNFHFFYQTKCFMFTGSEGVWYWEKRQKRCCCLYFLFFYQTKCFIKVYEVQTTDVSRKLMNNKVKMEIYESRKWFNTNTNLPFNQTG